MCKFKQKAWQGPDAFDTNGIFGNQKEKTLKIMTKHKILLLLLHYAVK